MAKIIEKTRQAVKEKGLFSGIEYIAGKSIYRILIRIYIRYYSKKNLPLIPDCYLFQSTPSFSDNAKALALYIHQKEPQSKIIFLLEGGKTPDVEGIQFYPFKNLKYNELSLKAIPVIFQSKYLLFTHESPVSNRWFSGKVSDEQLVINLWHGCGFKDKGKDETIPFVIKEYFDYAIVPGKLFIEPKSHFWSCAPEQILPIGYPRYDWMLEENRSAKEYADTFKKNGEKIIIWMPTFRKNVHSYMLENEMQYDFDLPILKNISELKQLNQYCQEKGISLIIKRHPQQQEYSCEKEQLSNIYFLSNQDFTSHHLEMYSFLRYSDGLISDYSSIAFDYMQLDRPIAYTLDDYDQYAGVRGFVFENPLDYMPGNHLYTYYDLIEFIDLIALNQDPYSIQRKAVKEIALNSSTHHCQDILDFIHGGKL